MSQNISSTKSTLSEIKINFTNPDQGVGSSKSHDIRIRIKQDSFPINENSSMSSNEMNLAKKNKNNNMKHSQEGESTNSDEHPEKNENIVNNNEHKEESVEKKVNGNENDLKNAEQKEKFCEGDYEITEMDYDIDDNNDYYPYYANNQTNNMVNLGQNESEQFLGQKRRNTLQRDIGPNMMNQNAFPQNKNITYNSISSISNILKEITHIGKNNIDLLNEQNNNLNFSIYDTKRSKQNHNLSKNKINTEENIEKLGNAQNEENVIVLNEEDKNNKDEFSNSISSSSSSELSDSSDEEFKYKYIKTAKKKPKSPEEIKIENELKEKKRLKLEKKKKEKEEAESKDTYIYTPYAELINLTQEYGFNLVIDLLIYYTNVESNADNNMESDEKKSEKNTEIEEKLKSIISKTDKQILSLYLLKLIYLYQKKNFQIYRDYEEDKENTERKLEAKKRKKMVLKTVKSSQMQKAKQELKSTNNNKISNNNNHTNDFIRKLTEKEKELERLVKEIKEKLKNNNLSKEERHKAKKRLRHLYQKEEINRNKEERHQQKLEEKRREKEAERRRNNEVEKKLQWHFKKNKEKIYILEQGKIVEEEFDKDRNSIEIFKANNVYRNRHFDWKDGFLYAYVPKDYITRSRCFLYCWKTGCKAKIRVDMDMKTCESVGQHIPHKSFEAEKAVGDYPCLLDKDWTHIQYDIQGNKRFVAWKI